MASRNPSSDVETSRGRLHLRDDGDGFPLVMLHGWPESGLCWEPVLPYLPGGLFLTPWRLE